MFALFVGIAVSCCAADSVHLVPVPSGSQMDIHLSAATNTGQAFEVRVQRTADFQTWEPFGIKVRIPTGGVVADSVVANDSDNLGFFRVATNATTFTASDDADLLGFAGAFRDQLDALGTLDPEAFARRYPAPTNYLSGLTWDPTTALYWTNFDNPNPVGTVFANSGSPGMWGPPVKSTVRLPPIALNQEELAIFSTNGFVVSDRLVSFDNYDRYAQSFADIYYDIFRRDLPVFISADSVLHAWH
jgi:hypothetical protein